MARPAYKKDKAPKVVSIGTVSRPKKLAKWNPGPSVKYATPRVVKAP